MNCDKTLELLSAELDGRLSETEHAELQAHLDECADCRRVYGTLRDVDAMLPETQLEPPKALHDAVMREVRADAAKRQQKKRWVPVAVIGAAAAAAFVLGSFGLIEMPVFQTGTRAARHCTRSWIRSFPRHSPTSTRRRPRRSMRGTTPVRCLRSGTAHHSRS